VVKNIIWAWPWTEEAPPVVPGVLQDSGDPQMFLAGVLDDCNTYTRELPYSYETLLENIVDPSHVPFAHHGLQGTRDDAIPVNLTLSSDVSSNGFTFDFADRTIKLVRRGKGEFRAPFVIQYNATFDKPAAAGPAKTKLTSRTGRPAVADPKFFNLTVICTPSRPGWSRVRLLLL
jgi:phenylpropionate dioxygenase-like ring-hydroxylating dioxygenase large terminal subunit